MNSEKLAASGRLAAALAHEINNPLQAVMNLMTLLGQAELSPQGREHATLAAKELDRVVHLIRQSLRETHTPKEVDLPDVLDSVLNLYAERLRARKITVEKQYRIKRMVKTHAADIRQVISNLLVNAMEASSEGDRIALRVREGHNERNNGGRGIRILLADNGVGIPSRNVERIFEPFFTTKGEHGTGIGLWITSAIVERIGGSIRVRSTTKPGKSGTCFSVFLPDIAGRESEG